MEATYNPQMMENYATEKTFSWRRVWMLFQLYYPLLKKQMICFPLLSALAVLLTAWLMRVNHVTSVIDMSWSVVGWPMIMVSIMFYLAPIGLARRDMRPLCAMLPVTAAEKMVFLILYLWVWTMVMTSGVCYVTAFVLIPFDPGMWNFIQDSFRLFNSLFGISVFSFWGWVMAWLYQTIVLYVVISVKRNRVLMGIVTYFVTSLAFGLISGLAAMAWALYMIFNKGQDYAKALVQDSATDAFSPEMSQLINFILTPIGIVSAILLVLILWDIYKKLKYRGI